MEIDGLWDVSKNCKLINFRVSRMFFPHHWPIFYSLAHTTLTFNDSCFRFPSSSSSSMRDISLSLFPDTSCCFFYICCCCFFGLLPTGHALASDFFFVFNYLQALFVAWAQTHDALHVQQGKKMSIIISHGHVKNFSESIFFGLWDLHDDWIRIFLFVV